MKRINSPAQYVVKYPGFEELQKSSDKYAEIFKQHGILCFRDANLDDNSSIDVLSEMSKYFHWSPTYIKSSGSLSNWKYTQHYDDRVGENNEFKPIVSADRLVNPWHLEGMYKTNTQHAAGWNMRNFKCSSSFGQTGFVDASELLEKISEDSYLFLKSCRLMHYPIFVKERPAPYEKMTSYFSEQMSLMQEKIWSKDGHMEIASNAHDAIEVHPSNGYEVLRLCPCVEEWGNQHLLFSVDGRLPTESEISRFNEIQEWLRIQLLDEENIWLHEWREGDFLIPDLFIMIHAARAGFSSGEREFDGFWCFEAGIDYSDESTHFRKAELQWK